jgi:hypothetical protein
MKGNLPIFASKLKSKWRGILYLSIGFGLKGFDFFYVIVGFNQIRGEKWFSL